MVPTRRLIALILIMLFGIVFLPFGYALSIGLGSPNYIIAAMFWEYVDSYYFTGLRILGLSEILSAVGYWIFRFIFLLQLIIYYKGGPNRTRSELIGVGIMMEFIPLLLSVPVLLNIGGWFSLPYQYVLPIPLLLILGLVIIHKYPKEDFVNPWASDI